MKRLWIACIAFVGVCARGGSVRRRRRRERQDRFSPEEAQSRHPSALERRTRRVPFAIVSDRTGGPSAGNLFASRREAESDPAGVRAFASATSSKGARRPMKSSRPSGRNSTASSTSSPCRSFMCRAITTCSPRKPAKFWEGKLGRRYYHFVYRNVLFLILNADDPPGSSGHRQGANHLRSEKRSKTMPNVRWTIVSVHRPLWIHRRRRQERLGARSKKAQRAFLHRFLRARAPLRRNSSARA